jgi:hypothetical protein
MPWHKHKNSKLVTHYGRWTTQEENDFYDSVSFSDWRGSSDIILCGKSLSQKGKEVKNVDGFISIKHRA